MLGIFVSFLILMLNLLVLGVVYWGITQILKLVPANFCPDPIKNVILTILKVIFVIIAVIWIAAWLIGLVGGSSLAVPMPFSYHLRP